MHLFRSQLLKEIIMDIKISKHYFPCFVRKSWIKLETKNPLTLPFQGYEFFVRTFAHFFPYSIKRRSVIVVFEAAQNGKTLALIPMEKSFWGGYKLFGDINGYNYCDAVYRETSVLRCILTHLKKYCGEITFRKVQVTSPLYECVKDIVKVTRMTENVKIDFGNDFDIYIKSLSKSTRQNLRTSVNRLHRDNHKMKLKAFYGGDNELVHEMKNCLNLYAKRHNERYGIKTSWIKKWLLLHHHFATSNYLHLPSAITFVLYIDDEMAGFMSGLTGNAGQYVVPRLSINSDFSFYSPGMLMLQEVVRYFIDNTDVRCLDLSQGDETYKYSMGGVAHETVDFVL